MQRELIERAKALLADGTVTRVIGWKRGDFDWDATPAVFTTAEALERGFAYDDFTAANVSKYLARETRAAGKVLAFLKPCDSYSLNQLAKEHRVARENVYAVGIPCDGKVDAGAVCAMGIDGIAGMASDGTTVTVRSLYGEKAVPRNDVLAERCANCKSKVHVGCDETLGPSGASDDTNAAADAARVSADGHRFDRVAEIEAMSPAERYEFWRGELSRCIRCNACRNACPACTCEKCVFDNDASGVAAKAAADPFEESMFHIIRAFHVAGRCTDCGECSRACPQRIPLHLLNRKIIADVNALYGDYQAGADLDARAPLNTFEKEDAEPAAAINRKGGKA